jgi:hypothetical protein
MTKMPAPLLNAKTMCACGFRKIAMMAIVAPSIHATRRLENASISLCLAQVVGVQGIQIAQRTRYVLMITLAQSVTR